MRNPLKRLAISALLLTLVYGVSHADQGFRDPTRPYTARIAGATPAPRFVVNAIIISSDRRVAIVNGRRVGIGGSVGAATVVAIEKHQLILEVDGKRITANLHDGTARR